MFNHEKLKLMKDAAVAVGLIDKTTDRKPLQIVGSGFFIDSRGYAITAKHVLDGCDELIVEYAKQKNVQLEIALFSVSTSDSMAQVRIMRDVKTYVIGIMDSFNANYVGPLDPDIGIVVPGEGIDDIGGTPFVHIKQASTNLDLYEEVVMCGYPSGDESLDLFRKHRGMRLSPIIQFGRLTGFMPTDIMKHPWGIQTDIVGTGGSSGSAIIDPRDGCVIGIAQNVFTGGIRGYTDALYLSDGTLVSNGVPVFGRAIVGLVYGISFHQFSDILDRIQKELQLPINTI